LNKIKWSIPQKNEDLIELISNQFCLNPVIAQLLINRGLTNAEDIENFLNPSLNQLLDPFLFPEMTIAVERIRKAVNNRENILVYGDYDVDGMTSTALLFTVLKKFSTNIYYYIPDRFEEGYGLSQRGIEFIKKYHIDLVITVDCGSTANGEIEKLNHLNVDTIITDHHEPSSDRPLAYAVINPKMCHYPFKNLAGVGVVFKLSQALYKVFQIDQKSLEENLDLVTLGTIADSVDVLGENRILLKYGFNRLFNSNKKGLRMLLENNNQSFLSGSQIERDISFGLIPILNSTGRIDNPHHTVDLLLTDSNYRADHLINKMRILNDKRKTITLKILEEARQMVSEKNDIKNQKVLVLASRDWHPGVIGIVASRIMEEFSKPVIMISLNGGIGKGSGRNQGEFNFSRILSSCSELLQQYGGHQYAAGITISEENIAAFNEKINHVLQNNSLIIESCQPTINIESILKYEDIDWNLINSVEEMRPFGPGNPQPVFGGYRFPVNSWKRVGKEGKHLKLSLGKQENFLDGIAFHLAGQSLEIKNDNIIDIAFQLAKNYWNGKNSIQLMVKDIKLSVRRS